MASKKRQEPKVALCTYHARIQRALAELECCMQREDAEAIPDAIDCLRRAQDAVEAAMPAGQAMEDRLREYRTAIEGLGFSRVYKKK